MIMKNLLLFMPFSLFPFLNRPSTAAGHSTSPFNSDFTSSYTHIHVQSSTFLPKVFLVAAKAVDGLSPRRENDLCHYSFNIPKAQEQLRKR